MNYLKDPSNGKLLDGLKVRYGSCAEMQAQVGQKLEFPEEYQEKMVTFINEKWKRSKKAITRETTEEAYMSEKMWEYFKSIESNFKNVYCTIWSDICTGSDSGRQIDDKMAEFLDKIFKADQEKKHVRRVEDNVKKITSDVVGADREKEIDRIKSVSLKKKKETPVYGSWFPEDYYAFICFGPPAGSKCDVIFDLQSQKSPRSVLSKGLTTTEYSEIVAKNRSGQIGRDARRLMGRKDNSTKPTTGKVAEELDESVWSLSIDSQFMAMMYSAERRLKSCEKLVELTKTELLELAPSNGENASEDYDLKKEELKSLRADLKAALMEQKNMPTLENWKQQEMEKRDRKRGIHQLDATPSDRSSLLEERSIQRHREIMNSPVTKMTPIAPIEYIAHTNTAFPKKSYYGIDVRLFSSSEDNGPPELSYKLEYFIQGHEKGNPNEWEIEDLRTLKNCIFFSWCALSATVKFHPVSTLPGDAVMRCTIHIESLDILQICESNIIQMVQGADVDTTDAMDLLREAIGICDENVDNHIAEHADNDIAQMEGDHP